MVGDPFAVIVATIAVSAELKNGISSLWFSAKGESVRVICCDCGEKYELAKIVENYKEGFSDRT